MSGQAVFTVSHYAQITWTTKNQGGKSVFYSPELFPSTANVILFQDINLKKCQVAELVHKSRLNLATSIYKDVVLPSIPNSYANYHSKCDSKYTALSTSSKQTVSTFSQYKIGKLPIQVVLCVTHQRNTSV